MIEKTLRKQKTTKGKIPCEKELERKEPVVWEMLKT